MNDQSALNCHQVSRRAAFTHLESAWQTYHSLRAGETDGVEANSKYLQITPDVSARYSYCYRSAVGSCVTPVLVYREGSSGRGCSSWCPPTAWTLWRNAPGRHLASCLMWRQQLQNSATWKESAQPPHQVSAALICTGNQMDQSSIPAENCCSPFK